MTRETPRTCHLCDAMCGVLIATEGDRVVGVRGDPDDVFSRGHVCPKAHALGELHHDPDRLRAPMRRDGARWEVVTWDEALDDAADRIAAVRRARGPDAVALYVGNPTVHDVGAMLGVPALLGALRTRNHFNANSQDANPKLLACLLMYGSSVALTVPDLDRTRHLLMLGANPAVSNGSTMSLGDVRRRLRGVRARGGRMVLVDPRRSETAALCDEHHFLRPGGDAALLLAMLHVLFAEGRIETARVDAVARGLPALRAAAERFSPARVSRATGLSPEVVTRLAREFSDATSAVAYARVGVCQSEFGVVASWLVEALNVVTGNFDRPGGAMFPSPAMDLAPIAAVLVGKGYDRWRSRVRGLPECVGALPSAAMIEEIETPGAGQVRGMITLAGNPVLSTPNGPRLARALDALDAMVSIDPYRNETTRHAHLVLPPCSPLARPHLDAVLQGLAVRNVARASLPVFTPSHTDRTDHEILTGLAARIVAREVAPPSLAGALGRAIARAMPGVDTLVDALLRVGPHRGMNLATLRAAPHGVDLGPLTSKGRAAVRTRDGLVDLAPDPLLADLDRLARWVDAPDDGALRLVGRRHLRSNNSWMHNCPSLVKGPDRATLLVHPADAARLGVRDGGRVRVRSETGAVVAVASVRDEVAVGVVSLPHGYGHDEAADTLSVAGRVAGPNVNALTSERRVEPVIGNSILNGVAVELTPLP